MTEMRRPTNKHCSWHPSHTRCHSKCN